MKKFFLIALMLQFSLIGFAQTDNTHHYTNQEISKLTVYMAELEKKIITANPDEPQLVEKDQITDLLKDTSHNYYDRDIIKIFKYIKDLEKKVALNRMLANEEDEVRDSLQPPIPLLLVKGTVIFDDSVIQLDFSKVSITVTDKASNEIVGIYAPNAKTGKYLFILAPGKKYLVTTNINGYQLYSEDFSPENKTESYEISHEIRLKKE